MLDIRFRGLPHILMGAAHPPMAVNANYERYAKPDAGMPDFPVAGLLWVPPAAAWVPMRPRSSRRHLKVVK